MQYTLNCNASVPLVPLYSKSHVWGRHSSHETYWVLENKCIQ